MARRRALGARKFIPKYFYIHATVRDMQTLNHDLFLLLNAPAPAHSLPVFIASFFATYLIYLLPVGLFWLAINGDAKVRRALTGAVLTLLLALFLGVVVSTLWPQPRPFVIPLGTNLLPHTTDAGFPSDHALVFFALAFGMLMQARTSWAAMPLLAAGVLVGWARIYLGVHFPADIVGALPVAIVAALIERSASRFTLSHVAVPIEAIYQKLRCAMLKVCNRSTSSIPPRDLPLLRRGSSSEISKSPTEKNTCHETND